MKMKVLNIDGNKTETVEVSDKIFVPKPNQAVIKTIVEWKTNNSKTGKAYQSQINEDMYPLS